MCAEISTHVEIEKTFALADESVTAALCDFLQYSAALFMPYDRRFKISWAIDVRRLSRWYFAVSDGLAENTLRHWEMASAVSTFEISAVVISKMQGWGLDRIADIVGREAPSEYDDLLQRAVRWYAKGEREEHPDDRKLSYVTAVDLFFANRELAATKQICKGFAFSVAANDDHIAPYARLMLRAFNSRSATSHRGNIGLMSAEEVDDLRHHVRNFIIAKSQQKFQTRQDVLQWMDAREKALSVGHQLALKDALNWKMLEAEQRISQTRHILRTIFHQALLSGREHQQAFNIARLFLDSLRNALAPGAPWMRDLAACTGDGLDELNEEMSEKLESKTATNADAQAYLAAIRKWFRSVKWLREELKRLNIRWSGATPEQGTGSTPPT